MASTYYHILQRSAIYNKKPIGFELSSNMLMCYAYNNHIYTFSFKTTYVFLVLADIFLFPGLCHNCETVNKCICMKILMPMMC